MSIEFALLHPQGRVEFVTADSGDLFRLIKTLVPDATPRQLGPLMMWDADTYTAEMPYNPVTEAVIGQGIGYYPGHDWRGPCAITMNEHMGLIPTLSAEMRDRITQWAAQAKRTWWQLSFASEAEFLGGFVTEAPSFEAAYFKSIQLRVNPGGEVQGVGFRAVSVDPTYVDRLLSKDETLNLPVSGGVEPLL